MLLHPPGAWDTLDQISPGLVDESGEMLRPLRGAPRILPGPQQSCRGLNKRKIRPVNVQQGFSDRLLQWAFGVVGLDIHTVAKSGPIHTDQGMSAPNLSANSRDEVQLHAHPSF